MGTPTELSVLLRLYTSKQNSPTINLAEFSDYLQKYARHYLQEAPELVMYIDDTRSVVQAELEKLEADSKVFITTDLKGKKLVFVPHFYIDRMIQRFREIDERIEMPFPVASEIPEGFPTALLKPVYITSDFTNLLESGERSNSYLNQLIFPDDTPSMIFPGSVSPEKLLDLAMGKIRLFLRKDESKDYIQKRLMMANPGKELTIKNYLVQFQTRPSESLSALKHSGEAFLFWSYLCSFIRQDYAKKNEKTPEEHALIQAVFITEFLNNYYKNKAQQSLQRDTALKNLDLCFQKPPYYYDMQAISKFVDSRGVPLLGQYRDTDLESFIKENTKDAGIESLPRLLVFKTEANVRYFVLKEKIAALILKLCNDDRKVIKDLLTREWFRQLTAFQQDESMKSQKEFERKIESICRTEAPLLYAVLNASFISLLSMEGNAGDKEPISGFKIFEHGRLLSYSELLMLNRQELLTDTRIMLPFWYTVPILSAIFAFFNRPKRPKAKIRNTAQSSQSTEKLVDESDAKTIRAQRKADLKNAAAGIEKKLIPAGSTLEAEMTVQLDLWNRTLDSQVKANLTEDVNSLIRDYIRRILKTIKATTFTLERVENLATALVDTPSLIKIKNREALLVYTQLYIIHLVRNIS